MSNHMPLLRKSIFKGFTKPAKHFKLKLAKHLKLKLAKHLKLKLAKHLKLKLAKHLGGAKQVIAVSAILVASLFSLSLRSQTMDQGTIQTTDNQSQWTTSQVQTPWVNNPYVGQALQVNFNDVNNSTQDGYWHAYDVSANLKALGFDISGNVSGTWDALPDSIAGQNMSVKYFVSETQNGRHGVGGKVEGDANAYEITAILTYTDTLTGEPSSVEFKVPDYLANYFMGGDTSAPIQFDPVSSYSSTANPQKLDSILNNIQDVMVLPEFDKNKTYMEQMNETSPHTGAGQTVNTTIGNVSNGGLNSPWSPENFTLLMEDHSSKAYTPKPTNAGNGPDPEPDDLETKVFQTDKGPVTVTYFMPEETVTHPGAEVINNYQVTTQAGEIPKFTVDADGLEYTVTSNQVNDTVFDVALGVKTPEGQNQTYNITVDIEGTTVTTANTTAAPDYNAVGMPNPFTSTTTLRYSLQQADNVGIVICDMQGRVVKEVFNGNQSAGMHELTIDGSDYSSGLYFLNITGSGGRCSVKLAKHF